MVPTTPPLRLDEWQIDATIHKTVDDKYYGARRIHGFPIDSHWWDNARIGYDVTPWRITWEILTQSIFKSKKQFGESLIITNTKYYGTTTN